MLRMASGPNRSRCSGRSIAFGSLCCQGVETREKAAGSTAPSFFSINGQIHPH
jgi:hypothetical protein